MKVFIFLVMAMVLANTAPAVGARGRMTNATDVQPKQFPSLVRIESYLRPHTSRCSGTLIRDDWVLTAAHCFFINDKKVNKVTVYMGSLERGAKHERNVVVNSVTNNVITHEDYNGNEKGDIALVKIPKIQITQKEDIGVASLSNEKDFVDKQVQVAGWGRLTDNGPDALHPQWSEFTVYANTNCKGFTYPRQLPIQLLCLYTPHVSACVGDSGGPVFYKNKLIGVAAFVHDDGCQSNNAMAYTNIGYYYDWVEEKIRSRKQ